MQPLSSGSILTSLGRLRSWWQQIHSSLWFLPALITAAAAVLAVVTVSLDRRGFGSAQSHWFILISGAEGARGVLGTIAGSIITVTGVVFSITIVVLQLASSQFSPRVLRSFTEDRSNQLVLGIFIGTFTYALLVLRTVRSEFSDYSRFVPSLSVNVAMLLALISMGFLIYFVHHITQSIQAEMIIARVTEDAMEIVNNLFPSQLGDEAEDRLFDEFARVEALAVVHSNKSGFIQGNDFDQMIKIAEECDLTLRLDHRAGSFVVDGDPLISVLRGSVPEDVADSLRATVVVGRERTRPQDVERGLIELTDIAVRALSPGINDPTTAIVCVHRLTEIFTQLGARRFKSVCGEAKDGTARVVAPCVEFSQLLFNAYGQLRTYGQKDTLVAAALKESLERVERRVATARKPAVRAELDRLLAGREELL